MSLRTLARTVAHNKSYQKCGTTDMFKYFFTKLWREKGHPAATGRKRWRACKKPYKRRK